MNKFDLQSAKFVGIIMGICFIFIMVIWNAFNYLPPKEDNNMATNQEINLPADEEQKENTQIDEKVQNDEDDERVEVKTDAQVKVFDSQKNIKELEPLEPVYDNTSDRNVPSNSDIQNNENPLDTALNNARNYSKEHKYASSISEYQKAISLTNDNSVKAQCYENIAKIYATTKRYGSALSAAQKAFNTEPSTSREVLLARLYYKTGDVDKATNRINNVLKRDFSLE